MFGTEVHIYALSGMISVHADRAVHGLYTGRRRIYGYITQGCRVVVYQGGYPSSLLSCPTVKRVVGRLKQAILPFSLRVLGG